MAPKQQQESVDMDKEDNKHCSLDLPEDREVDDCDDVDNEDEDEDEIGELDNEDEIEEFMEDDTNKDDEKYDGTTDLSEDAEAETEAGEGEGEAAEADEDSSDQEFEVDNFIKDGKHYSHNHPLRLTSRSYDYDKEEVGDADDKLRSCKICGLPILSCPSYECSRGCKFFLHQPCALKFPTKFIHPTFLCIHGRHKLGIQKASTNFIYKCEDCEFVLHPLVAFPHLEIKTKHKSHPSHSLVVFHKEISCECDACGREQRGFFFYCGDCNFWIHPDCTVLPTILQFPDHPYPFILAYSLPSYYVVGRNCVICQKLVLGNHNGVYFSPQSTNAAHVTCGSMHKSASQVRSILIQLPDDEQDTIFPSSVIHGYAANKKHVEVDDDGGRLTIQKYHKQHPLILIDGDCGESTWINIIPCCDLCTRAVNNSSSFYKCESCHFVAHKICADILPMLDFVIPLRKYADPGVELCPDPSEIIFHSIFYCIFCRRPCNGLCYYFTGANFIGLDGLPYLFIDLECMVTPSFINHASHAQHLLFRTHRLLETTTPLSCCSDYSLIYDVYRCIVCDYYIHVSCAMLPKMIIFHEYEEHPLFMVFNTLLFRLILSFTRRRDTFCEVCEEEIDLNYWLYRCEKCDKSFHINCIPSVGYLSKVKFGGTTLSLPNYSHINHAYDHPLSLTRMLTVPSQRCGYCNQIIKGLVDEMAFSCEKCQFWLHFSCARDATATPKTTKPLRLYSEIDYERLITEMNIMFA